MPGVKKAELKARRRRSAAQLTGSLLPGTGTGRRAPGGPDLEPAVAGDLNQPKEEFEEKDLIERMWSWLTWQTTGAARGSRGSLGWWRL